MRLTKKTTRFPSPFLIAGTAALLQGCTDGTSVSHDVDVVVTGTSERSPINAGEQAIFHVTVSNKGPNDAKKVRVQESVGDQSKLLSIKCEAHNNGACPSQLGPAMVIDTLAKDAAVEFIVTASLAGQNTGTILNSLSASVPEDNNPNDNAVNNDVIVR